MTEATAPVILRQSAFAALADGCLHRYHQIWECGAPDMSDPALIGLGFHAIKHAYINRLLAKQLRADAEEAHLAFLEGAAASKTPGRLLPELRQLWEFHSEGWFFRWEDFVASEDRLLWPPLSWAADLILRQQDVLELFDDKSGWAPPPTEAELRMNLQARAYCYGAMRHWPTYRIYRFTLNAVRWGHSTSVDFMPAELEAVELELDALMGVHQQATADGSWPAVPGPACAWCQLVCPLERPGLLPLRLRPEDETTWAGYDLAQHEQHKKLRARLKEAVDVRGPITAHGMTWANRPIRERSYHVDDVVRVLARLGVPITHDDGRSLTFSHSALAKIFRAVPAAKDALEPKAQERETYRFSAQSAQADPA